MDCLKELVGSIINSFLGPYKSNKFVVQDKDICITRCPLHIFQSSHIQGTLSMLIEETLFAHHELYGCSTLSLLAMWYLWYQEFKLALEEGCEMQDIIMFSQDLLELVISSIPEITINVDSLLVFKKHGYEKATKEVPLKKLNAFGQAPISVLYSSRHFSPTQSALHLKDERRKYKENSKLDENSMKTLIQRLDHDGDPEMSDLVLECWKRQRSVTDCSEFQTDGILICPIILPCSNSTVIDGLIIKSNSNYAPSPDRKKISINRSLIIKGSITFEHVHLGFSPKISISVDKTYDSSLTSEREKWRKKCCEFILQINIDVLMIKDDIDPDVANFCSSHSILVLPHIPLGVFKILCNALQYSPSTYIWDCNKDSVLKNLRIEEWKPHDSMNSSNQYFLCWVTSVNIVPLQTMVICHPSQALLVRMEHQLWHLVSRLNMCFQSKKLLPGGEVEEWCSEFLRKSLQSCEILDSRSRICFALASGYENYSKIVSSKKALSTEPSAKTLDEMSSKLSAWRSSLSLVLLTLQCDTVIINGIQDISEQTVSFNVNTL